LIDAHLSWNSLSTVPLAEISLDALTEWRQWSEGLGQILNKNSELATSLEHFVLQKLGQLTAWAQNSIESDLLPIGSTDAW